jgi:hypothetical protein
MKQAVSRICAILHRFYPKMCRGHESGFMFFEVAETVALNWSFMQRGESRNVTT